jgi:hypothetical protein
LMASNGCKRQQIAQDLAVHRATVHAWLTGSGARGLKGSRSNGHQDSPGAFLKPWPRSLSSG